MKKTVGLFLLVILFSCKAKDYIEIPEKWKTEKPEFRNQGEYEDYSAWKFFKNEYKKESYKTFEDSISKSGNEITFSGHTIGVFCIKEYKHIFTGGIIYPEIIRSHKIGGKISNITNVEELTFLESDQKVKRFRMWVSDNELANPIVYFFELTNNKAKGSNLTTTEFIEGAKLTFLKQGWLIM